MNKIALLLLSGLVITTILIGSFGCTPTSAPAPAPTAVVSEGGAAVVKEGGSSVFLTLRINVMGPARTFTFAQEWWAEQVTEKTNGAIKFEHFYNDALGAHKEQLDNLKAGTFEIGFANPAQFPAKVPLHFLINAPVGLSGDSLAHAKAGEDLSATPELAAELDSWNVKRLFSVQMPSYQIISTKKVSSLAELKGVKLWSAGSVAKLLGSLGAVPVTIPAGEVYEAINLGTLDGAAWPLYACVGYRLHEVSKYYTVANLGAAAFPFLINLDTWNDLPSDVQQIMLDVATQVGEKHAKAYDDESTGHIATMEEIGIELLELSADDQAVLKDAGKVLWYAMADEQGAPGPDIVKAYEKAITKYER